MQEDGVRGSGVQRSGRDRYLVGLQRQDSRTGHEELRSVPGPLLVDEQQLVAHPLVPEGHGLLVVPVHSSTGTVDRRPRRRSRYLRRADNLGPTPLTSLWLFARWGPYGAVP